MGQASWWAKARDKDYDMKGAYSIFLKNLNNRIEQVEFFEKAKRK